MEEFEFTISQKVQIWQDVTFTVKAKSKLKALKIIKDIAQNEYDCAYIDYSKHKEFVTITNREYGVESQDPIYKTKNSGVVREIFDADGNNIHFEEK
jgi:hypothetical protein